MKTMFIENGMIDQMVRNKQYTDAFPFLLHAASKPTGGCSGCGSSRINVDYGLVKRSIASLGPNDRAKLKAMLGVDVVKVTRRVNGRLDTVEF